MTSIVAMKSGSTLPQMIEAASRALAGARTAAEVLEARGMASAAYDVAKAAARLAKAKKAHDDIIAAMYRAQADAIEIEAQAKRRLADEYDEAQKRGEARKDGQRGKGIPGENSFSVPTVEELGLTSKDIHEARQVRDAEKRRPGVVHRAVEEAIAEGREPTRAAVRRAVSEVLPAKSRSKSKKSPERGQPGGSCDFDWDNVKPEDFGDADTAYQKQAEFYAREALRYAETNPILRVNPKKVTQQEIQTVRNVAQAWSELGDKLARHAVRKAE